MIKGITINETALKKHGVSFAEALVLLSVYYKVDLNKMFPLLIEKGFVSKKYFMNQPTDEFFISDKGVSILEGLTIDSDVDLPKEDRLKDLALKMQTLFPQGKKQGTTYYWRGNVPDIVKKLNSFFKKYGYDYTDEQILAATERYVQSFKNNNTYMQLLKYLIWKKNLQTGEEVSELMNYIENSAAVENRLDDDWTSKVI